MKYYEHKNYIPYSKDKTAKTPPISKEDQERYKKTGTYNKSKAVSKTLDKARGGMIGDLKRTMRDKDLKKDHYQAFKNQHNIK